MAWSAATFVRYARHEAQSSGVSGWRAQSIASTVQLPRSTGAHGRDALAPRSTAIEDTVEHRQGLASRNSHSPLRPPLRQIRTRRCPNLLRPVSPSVLCSRDVLRVARRSACGDDKGPFQCPRPSAPSLCSPPRLSEPEAYLACNFTCSGLPTTPLRTSHFTPTLRLRVRRRRCLHTWAHCSVPAGPRVTAQSAYVRPAHYTELPANSPGIYPTPRSHGSGKQIFLPSSLSAAPSLAELLRMPWSAVGLLERLRRPPQLGNDMLVDAEYDEKQDVAIISPDDTMDEAEQEPDPRADDFDAMKKRFMPEIADLETEAEAAHTWEIKEWRSMARREHGPVFKCAGHPWRILFFPYGNNTDHASFYLEQGFDESKPPEDWYACVQFMLVLWNPNDPAIYVQHSATHRFTADEGDWGFTRFAELRKLFQTSWEDHDRPLVENNCANVTAYVRVIKDPTGVLWHNFINYDSKKETGMVGLKNQGATCYLNSLLQSLYFTNAFRKAVYQIPTESEQERSNSAYALQRLFYQLQTSNVAVSTNELTASFGWDSRQIFEQQDVQELSRILMERMEEKMKGTEAENALPKMFVGKMKTYISCINVPYESSRIEDFWDIQLNVSGNKNLDDSFRDYIQVETMDGENKYFAEGYGLQDAKKGVIFESFPDVLHLQLKRFEYDFNRDAMMKVNDRYEFPEVWDASPYLSESADRSEPYLYHLHGILVHSGDLNAGHYYAFLKPTKDSPYFKFDDDRVTRATVKEALEENFGGDYTNLVNGNNQQRNPYTRTWSTKRSMSAYMLVYIRENRLDHVLLKDEEVQPPAHLGMSIRDSIFPGHSNRAQHKNSRKSGQPLRGKRRSARRCTCIFMFQ